MKDWELGKCEHAMSQRRVVLGSFCDFFLFSLWLLAVSLNDYFYYRCNLLGTYKGSEKLPGEV